MNKRLLLQLSSSSRRKAKYVLHPADVVFVVVRRERGIEARDDAGVHQVVDEVLDAVVGLLETGTGVDQERLAGR